MRVSTVGRHAGAQEVLVPAGGPEQQALTDSIDARLALGLPVSQEELDRAVDLFGDVDELVPPEATKHLSLAVNPPRPPRELCSPKGVRLHELIRQAFAELELEH